MTADLDLALLAGCTVLLVGILAVRVVLRLGLPSLLFYLALGLVIGEAGLGVRFDDADLTRDVGLLALVLILAEGGLTGRLSALRPVARLATVLATVGIAVSVLVVSAAVRLVLDLDWRTALVLAAVVSSTDAAAVFSVLRRLRLRGRLSATLEAESGLNDAPVVVLVTLAASDTWGQDPWWWVAVVIVGELLLGALVGWAVGQAGRWLLPRLALPAVGLYPLAALALIVLAYATAVVAHASGFLAAYIAAVLLGSARLPHRRAVLGFAEGLAWLAQIGLFVLLGLLASPARLPDAVPLALVAGGVLLLVARPLSVAVSATPFRVPWREQAFLSLAGLRGAVPIVLATIPLSEGLPNATLVFDATFLMVVVLTAIQAPPLPFAARRLGVASPAEAGELDVEIAPLDELGAALLEVPVPPGSRLAGAYVPELRLPEGAVVTLVVHGGQSTVPDRGTRLRQGDRLLVVTTAPARAATVRRLRAVNRRGVLARWLGDEGDEEP
ncbi:MAG: potassium/proton antiporter [Actinomycetia bacterium]|nr:potassium/proton antiporter [Actinomycetes bacterium]